MIKEEPGQVICHKTVIWYFGCGFSSVESVLCFRVREIRAGADLQCLDGWSRVSPMEDLHTLQEVTELLQVLLTYR